MESTSAERKREKIVGGLAFGARDVLFFFCEEWNEGKGISLKKVTL